MTGYIGIGGTAKKIKNIYIGVNGVAKQVKKAYIGVGGVAKQWYSSTPPTLSELFTDLQAVGYVSSSVSLGYVNFFAGRPSAYYLFIMGGADNNIYFVNNGIASLVNRDGTKDFAVTEGISLTDIDGGTGYRGFSCVAAQFPHFSQATVQSMLSGMTMTRLAGRNGTSTGYIYTSASNIHNEALYIASWVANSMISSYYSGMSFSLGSSYGTPIYAIGEKELDEEFENPNYAFLYKYSNNIYVSPTGNSRTTAIDRNGGIVELTL